MNTAHFLSDDERRLTLLLAEVWDLFMSLPVEHPMDRDEFCRGVHQLQDKVLSRPGRRQVNAIEQVVDDSLTIEDAAQLQTAIEEFDECGETSVDYEVLMRFAKMGFLECSHFHVMPAAQAAIDASHARGEKGGA
jgi:hypothetical protein